MKEYNLYCVIKFEHNGTNCRVDSSRMPGVGQMPGVNPKKAQTEAKVAQVQDVLCPPSNQIQGTAKRYQATGVEFLPCAIPSTRYV